MIVSKRDFEETLDPVNWEELKALGHEMVDDMVDHIATVRQRPPMMFIDEKTASAFMTPPPMEP